MSNISSTARETQLNRILSMFRDMERNLEREGANEELPNIRNQIQRYEALLNSVRQNNQNSKLN
ncbi:MAG: hypothetical protein MJ252_27660 [archaeon]|nr:hypothetical protein [archaeon]